MSEDKPKPFKLTSWTLQTIVFAAMLLILFILVCKIFSPFFTVLMWSVLLYIMVQPLYEKISRKLDFTRKKKNKFKRSVIAGVFALGTTFLILVPLTFVLAQLVLQFRDLLRSVRNIYIDNPHIIQEALEKIQKVISDISDGQIELDTQDIQRNTMSIISYASQKALSYSSTIAIDMGKFALNCLFMVFCLFFFFLDGPFLSHLFLDLFPIRADYITVLVSKFKEIARNLILGYILVALVQSICAYLVFLAFSVKGALVFASITFVCVFIPMIGGAIVWLPLGIAKIISGDIVGGVLFIIISGTFISLLDNFLRPVFLQNRIQLHPLIIFFAILGGLQAFNFNGIVLGPIIVILFLTVLDLFQTEHNLRKNQPDSITEKAG
jgi:predicted PurR-regulated permease PerM